MKNSNKGCSLFFEINTSKLDSIQQFRFGHVMEIHGSMGSTKSQKGFAHLSVCPSGCLFIHSFFQRWLIDFFLIFFA